MENTYSNGGCLGGFSFFLAATQGKNYECLKASVLPKNTGRLAGIATMDCDNLQYIGQYNRI